MIINYKSKYGDIISSRLLLLYYKLYKYGNFECYSWVYIRCNKVIPILFKHHLMLYFTFFIFLN